MNIIDKITVNEQSSIRIAADKVLYFDPIHISGEPHDADIIFITHEHYDHFSPDDISKVSNSDTIFAAPESMAKGLCSCRIKLRELLHSLCHCSGLIGALQIDYLGHCHCIGISLDQVECALYLVTFHYDAGYTEILGLGYGECLHVYAVVAKQTCYLGKLSLLILQEN